MPVDTQDTAATSDLLDVNDVMRIAKVSAGSAYELMRRAGAIRLGKGRRNPRALRVRATDLYGYLESIKVAGVPQS